MSRDMSGRRTIPASVPTITVLCGSTRFMDAFHEANQRLSLEGKIVLTVEIVHYDHSTDPQRSSPFQKAALDELHLRKIELADEVLVLNVNGYVGESTRREVSYAERLGKPIHWLEPVKDQSTAHRQAPTTAQPCSGT